MIAGEMKKGKNKFEVTIVAQYHQSEISVKIQ